jgi:hypothetical protein
MQQHFLTAALLAFLSSAGVAAAQQSGGSSTTQPQLNAQQQHSVGQGLAQQPNDNAPSGYQGQVGTKLPDSVTAHPMPNNVTADVPQAKNLLFVKLPDRVLLIDPDSQVVAELILAEDTTGSSGNSSGAQRPDSQK